MNMPQIPVIVKDNWPYFLGGAVGLFLIFKVRGNTQSNQPAQIVLPGYDSGAANQAQLQQSTLQANIAASNNDAQIKFLAVQGNIATQLGGAASQIISALQMPTIQAINSANIADAATIETAGNIAISGMRTRAALDSNAVDAIDIYGQMSSSNVRSVADSVRSANNTNSQNKSSSWGGLGSLAKIGASVYTGMPMI